MSVNQVVLVGRITRDPEKRLTNSGISVCTFNVAVDRNINRKTAPEGTVTADFPTCVCYRGTADFMGDYVKKGDLLSIVGRLQTRHYEKDGHTVYVTEVIVDRLKKEERRDAAREDMGQPAMNAPAPQPVQPRQQNGGYNNPYPQQPRQYGQPGYGPRGGYNGYPNTQNGYDPNDPNRKGPLDLTNNDLPF